MRLMRRLPQKKHAMNAKIRLKMPVAIAGAVGILDNVKLARRDYVAQTLLVLWMTPIPRRCNMRRYFALSACALAVLATAMPAEARINQRQNHQQQRIANGISKGSLTSREAVRVERQQVHIARFEARNRADGGGLNRNERARLEVLQDRASRTIRNQKRDAQRR
jgi:hypothetical protein